MGKPKVVHLHDEKKGPTLYVRKVEEEKDLKIMESILYMMMGIFGVLVGIFIILIIALL
jgi:hypothetical protein